MQQVIYRIPWQTSWFPDGIPIYGFGLMLFIAFILCTWLAGRRVTRMIQNGIGLGRYIAGPNQGKDYPAGEKVEEKIEAAKSLIQDLAIVLFITGLAGARITYMYHHPTEGGFWAQLVDITNGGIILYGSVVGAVVGYGLFSLYHYVRRQVVFNMARIADLAAPSIAVGIGLGRIGCLLNGCCYGHVACADCKTVYTVQFPMSAPPRYALVEKGYQTAAGFLLAEDQPEEGVKVGEVDPHSAAYAAGLREGQVITKVNDKALESNGRDVLTRALFIDWQRGRKDLVLTIEDPEKVLSFRPKTLDLYPTQLFETVSMALLFWLLTEFFAYRTRDGQVAALLMMCYAVHRTLNEMLRDDVRPVGFESYSSYILFVLGALLMLWATLRPKQYESEWKLVK